MMENYYSHLQADTWLQTMGHHSGPMKLREVFCKIDSNDDDDILFLAKVEC